MTEINWSFTLYRAGAPVTSGSLSTFDLSFPESIIARLIRQYNADKVVVRDSCGRRWEKVCG